MGIWGREVFMCELRYNYALIGICGHYALVQNWGILQLLSQFFFCWVLYLCNKKWYINANLDIYIVKLKSTSNYFYFFNHDINK